MWCPSLHRAKNLQICILKLAGRHPAMNHTYRAAMLKQIKICVLLSRAAIRGARNADMDAFNIAGRRPAMKRTRCWATFPSSDTTLLPVVGWKEREDKGLWRQTHDSQLCCLLVQGPSNAQKLGWEKIAFKVWILAPTSWVVRCKVVNLECNIGRIQWICSAELLERSQSPVHLWPYPTNLHCRIRWIKWTSSELVAEGWKSKLVA